MPFFFVKYLLEMPMTSAQKIVVLFIFVLSGCAGLIYESVWSHYLGHFLGHAALAQTLTLAIFMGGMALGAWWISVRINRIGNALRLYALIELILGLLGLVFHGFFTTVLAFAHDVLFPWLEYPLLVQVFKWTLAALLILPQSILLGMTFPLISSGLIRRTSQAVGGLIAILYFANSIGAVFGAMGATFVLLPAMGMPGALLVAGLLNVLVAIGAYYYSKIPEELNQADVRSDEIQSKKTAIPARVVLLAAALTGFASFVYEIAWIRMLNQVMGTTLHAFELMLSAFIAGLAFGGLWIKRRINQIQDLARFTAWVQIIMGFMALLSLPLYIASFEWVALMIKSVIAPTSAGYTAFNILTAGLAVVIMVPTTFFAGMTLPLLTTTLMRQGENESAIGRVYSSNTIGSILGVWFAIHIGMVLMGLKYLVIFAALVDVAVGLMLMTHARFKSPEIQRKHRFGALAGLLLVSTFSLWFADFSPHKLASGTYRYGRAEVNPNDELFYYRDGKSASIAVFGQRTQANGIESLAKTIMTNGKPDAKLNVTPGGVVSVDEPTMVLAAVLPLLYKPDARTVANIGFGSGLTSNVMLGSDHLEKLDSIEIEPHMVEGAKEFSPRNDRVYMDPRSNIIIEDAKTFFATHNETYDVIVSEPSNPWVMGVGNLFTQEFYRDIKKYLNRDGILIQWLQLYEISPHVIGSAFNALSSQFPHYRMYFPNESDVIIVASQEPLRGFSVDTIEELPIGVQQELNQIGITDLTAVASRLVADESMIRPLFQVLSSVVNSDYFPILTLNAPRDRFIKAQSFSVFNISHFSVPFYRLIQHRLDWRTVESEQLDHIHYFHRILKHRDRLLSLLAGQAQVDLNEKTWGHWSMVNNSPLFCGVSPGLENEWLNAYIELTRPLVFLADVETLQAVQNSAVVQECLEKTPQQLIPEFLKLQLNIAQSRYATVISAGQRLLFRSGLELNSKVVTEVFKYMLFVMNAQPEVYLTQENIDMVKKNQEMIANTNNTELNWLNAIVNAKVNR